MSRRVVSSFYWWSTLDRIAAIIILEMLGNMEPQNYPNFDARNVIEVSEDEIGLFDLAIGIGCGPFGNQNPDGSLPEKSITLRVAEHFNLFARYPQTKSLVEDVNRLYRGEEQGALSFDQLIKNVALFERSKERTIEFARIALSARIDVNYHLFHSPEIKAAYENAQKYAVLTSSAEKQVVVYQVSGENETISPAPYAFWQGAAIVIILHTDTGQVQILSNEKMKLNLLPIYENLREIETVPGKWHFQPPYAMMNGSLTHPKVPATGISFTNIVNLCRILLRSCLPKKNQNE